MASELEIFLRMFGSGALTGLLSGWIFVYTYLDCETPLASALGQLSLYGSTLAGAALRGRRISSGEFM